MTIALIDDDEAVLHSLRLLLESRGFDVRSFASAEEFLKSVGTAMPACVVTDVRMPDVSGLELQIALKKRDSSVPVILITGHGEIAMAVDAIKQGAFDFLEKPFDEERLIQSITNALEASRKLRDERDQRVDLDARVAELSPRQREVMLLVAEGLSNKEIALRLDISPRTVENYRAWVMEKMGARGLAELVRMVMLLDKG